MKNILARSKIISRRISLLPVYHCFHITLADANRRTGQTGKRVDRLNLSPSISYTSAEKGSAFFYEYKRGLSKNSNCFFLISVIPNSFGQAG